ncbi:hypothetical protein [Aquabacterium sp.]|uniref:hypothetical protein n=1 Tax=Aquabacterium sp. TaxID=1872578 RepID=UPI0025BD390B|nr:hypothetical protein [Aquabacterium sp.]
MQDARFSSRDTMVSKPLIRRHRLGLAVALLALGGVMAPQAQAYQFNSLEALGSQGNFELLAKDLSAALALKPMAPAAGLGLLGFDLGVTTSVTQLSSVAVLERAAGTTRVPGNLPVVGVRAAKGLPFGFDVGVGYSAIPGTSVRASSGELKWAFVSGGLLMPAVAVRGFYTQASGLGRMSLRSRGVDLSVSKGIAMVTPYAGVGVVQSTATTSDGTWSKASYYQPRVFAGANLNLLLLNVAAEVDKTGEDTSYQVKLGLRF